MDSWRSRKTVSSRSERWRRLESGHSWREIVRALAINVEAIGRPVLPLRRERVKLNSASCSLPNVFTTQVLEMIYLGYHACTRVSVCDRDDFVIKLPT